MSVRANRSQGGTGAVASEGAAVLKKERQASFQQVKEGTQEWFENARRRCVDHLRALISVRAASTYASAILDRWSNEDIEILAGLHLASVIAYTRPFTSAFTKDGKVMYRVNMLARAPGFDRRLHAHLMELRNRLLAHADYAVLPSTMYLQTIGDEALPVAIGINVKSVAGMESRSLAERYQSHFRVCLDAIEDVLNVELRELATEGQKYPIAFNATHNLPAIITKSQIGDEWATVAGPAGPAGDVAEPSFSEGPSGYRYLLLRHELALVTSGTHTVHMNGMPTEITFDVSQPNVPQ